MPKSIGASCVQTRPCPPHHLGVIGVQTFARLYRNANKEIFREEQLGLSRVLFENKGQCGLFEIWCCGRRSGDDRVEVLGEWVCKARQGLSGFAVRGLPRLGKRK
jgi:hypothetical protein